MKDKQREELLEILKVLLDEDLTWFEVRTPSAYIRIGAGPEPLGLPALGPAPAYAAPPAAGHPAVAAPPVRETAVEAPAKRGRLAPAVAGEHLVTAPFAGVFYRRPSPAEPPFVEVGTRVHATDTVCLVEVMKLFNSVQAGADGVVTAIEVGDGELVEYGQALLRIAPLVQASSD